MSSWKQFDFEARVRAILADIALGSATNELGTPFLTAHQIAIEFEARHRDDVGGLGLTVSGQGAGVHASLARYLAWELSRRIRSGELPDIEEACLSGHRVLSFVFAEGVESSAGDLPIYRLRSGDPETLGTQR